MAETRFLNRVTVIFRSGREERHILNAHEHAIKSSGDWVTLEIDDRTVRLNAREIESLTEQLFTEVVPDVPVQTERQAFRAPSDFELR